LEKINLDYLIPIMNKFTMKYKTEVNNDSIIISVIDGNESIKLFEIKFILEGEKKSIIISNEDVNIFTFASKEHRYYER